MNMGTVDDIMGEVAKKCIPLLILFRVLAEETDFPTEAEGFTVDRKIYGIIEKLEDTRS